MSTATAEVQLPSVDEAGDVIDRELVKRAFFQRMKERGHVPPTEKAARSMWNLALKLANEAPQEAANDIYSQCEEAHDNLLKSGSAEADEVALVKQAAWELAHNPVFYNAALVIKAEEAEQLAAQGK